MKFKAGLKVSLGENQYEILDRLAGGVICDVYLARPQNSLGYEVAIKLVRDGSGLEMSEKVAAMQHEVDMLTQLNLAEDPQWLQFTTLTTRLQRCRETSLQRGVIALLDSGKFEGQPFLVMEKAPEPFEPFTVDGLVAERRMLLVFHAVATVIALAHKHNLVLKDFDPYSKGNRICIGYSDDLEQVELKIIDWNIRGSSSEEMRQDLFFLGGHFYYFLLGDHITLDENGQPPLHLGLGVSEWERFAPGTYQNLHLQQDAYEVLSEGTRQILQRLLHRYPAQRYQQAAEVVDDLAWWLKMLDRAKGPNAVEYLDDQLWQARSQELHNRVLAVVDLILRVAPEDREGGLKILGDQAQAELEKVVRIPIAQVRVSLLTEMYDKAEAELSQKLETLHPDSLLAYLAQLYRNLAQAGAELQKIHKGVKIRTVPEWQALDRAVEELGKGNWQDAKIALDQAVERQPIMNDWLAVKDLYVRIKDVQPQSPTPMVEPDQPVDTSSTSELSTTELAAQSEQLEPNNLQVEQSIQSPEELEEANLSPSPTKAEAIEWVEQRVREGLAEVQEYKQKTQFKEVNERVQQILAWHNQPLGELLAEESLPDELGQHRFQLPPDLGKELKSLRNSIRLRIKRLHKQVQKAQRQQRYKVIVAKLEQLETIGHILTAEEKQWLEDAGQHLRQEREAQETLTAIKQAFKDIKQEVDFKSVEESIWRLQAGEIPTEVREELGTLHQELGATREAHTQAQLTFEQQDYQTVINTLEQLGQQGRPITESANHWLAEARQRQGLLDEAQIILESPSPNYERVLELLTDETGLQGWKYKSTAKQKQKEQQAQTRLKQMDISLQAGQWQAVEETVKELLAWENETLFEEATLPPEFDNRFQLSLEMKETLKQLEIQITLISDLRRQIKAAETRQAWTEVIKLLEELADKRPLIESEKRQKQEAQKKLQEAQEKLKEIEAAKEDAKAELDQLARRHLNAAREELKQGEFEQVKNRLQSILREWPRRNLADLWPEKDLGPGIGALPGQVSAEVKAEVEAFLTRVAEIEAIHKQVEQARQAGDALATLSALNKLGMAHIDSLQEETWRTEAQGKLTQALTKIAELLDMTGGGWPAWFGQLPQLEERLNYIGQRLGRLRGTNIIPDEQKQQAETLHRQFIEALERFLRQQLSMATSGNQSGDANIRAALEKAKRYWDKIPAFLRQELSPELGSEFEAIKNYSQAEQVRRQLAEAGQQVRDALKFQQTPDLDTFQRLYWQVRDYQEQVQIWPGNSVPASLNQAREAAEKLVYDLRDEAAKSFERTMHRDGSLTDLQYTQRILACLSDLNQGLATPPSELSAPTPEQSKALLERGALKYWQNVSEFLQTLTTSDSKTEEQINQLQEMLKVWDGVPLSLDLKSWPGKDKLNTLRIEFSMYVRAASHLNQANSYLQDKDEVEKGLTILGPEMTLLIREARRRRVSLPLPPDLEKIRATMPQKGVPSLAHWLLLGQRKSLQQSFSLLHDRLVKVLPDYIFRLLVDVVDDDLAEVAKKRVVDIQDMFPPESWLFSSVGGAMVEAFYRHINPDDEQDLYLFTHIAVVMSLLKLWLPGILVEIPDPEAATQYIEDILETLQVQDSFYAKYIGSVMIEVVEHWAIDNPTKESEYWHIISRVYYNAYQKKLKHKKGWFSIW